MLQAANGQLFKVVAIAQSDTTKFVPPLKGLLVLRVADVTHNAVAIKRPDGTTVTLALPSAKSSDEEGGKYPFILPCAIRQVLDTGTTLADADMFGII